VQKVKSEQITFDNVATAVLQMVLREGHYSKRIDVVTYKKIQSKTVKGCYEVKRASLVHKE